MQLASTLNPQPSTLNHQPSTLNPEPGGRRASLVWFIVVGRRLSGAPICSARREEEIDGALRSLGIDPHVLLSDPRSNRLFHALDLCWRSLESGGAWYKSRRLKKTICSPSEGWWAGTRTPSPETRNRGNPEQTSQSGPESGPGLSHFQGDFKSIKVDPTRGCACLLCARQKQPHLFLTNTLRLVFRTRLYE